MDTRIIKSELTALEQMDLENYFYNCIKESINSCSEDCVNFYEDCEISEYFGGGYEEIWNENDYEGDGFNCIWFKVVVTEENKKQIENCFNNARERAWEDYLNN